MFFPKDIKEDDFESTKLIEDISSGACDNTPFIEVFDKINNSKIRMLLVNGIYIDNNNTKNITVEEYLNIYGGGLEW